MFFDRNIITETQKDYILRKEMKKNKIKQKKKEIEFE